MAKFKVGDRVEAIAHFMPGHCEGFRGTVARVDKNGGFQLIGCDGNGRGEPFNLAEHCWKLVDRKPLTLAEVKLGDRIRRIKDEHMGMGVGHIATIIELVPGNSVRLREWQGSHAIYNFESTEEAQPVPEVIPVAEFKVGDKGKRRDGTPYEIVAVGVKGLPKDRSIVVVSDGVLSSRFPNGKFHVDAGENGSDLMPPFVCVYQLTFSKRLQGAGQEEIPEEAVGISVYRTEKAANDRIKALKGYYENFVITPIEREA